MSVQQDLLLTHTQTTTQLLLASSLVTVQKGGEELGSEASVAILGQGKSMQAVNQPSSIPAVF